MIKEYMLTSMLSDRGCLISYHSLSWMWKFFELSNIGEISVPLISPSYIYFNENIRNVTNIFISN